MPSRTRKKAEPRAPLSRERALEVAVKLADDRGIEHLTMRNLAQELGIEAMSLYHHVANKEAILDGMVDLVFAEIELPSTQIDWKTAMRRRARSVRASLARHPWAVNLLESRSTPGLATLRHHEAMLACLRHAGFSLPMTGHAYSVLDSYLYGFVHQELNLPFDSEDTSQEVTGAILEKMPLDQFPRMAEFAMEHVLKPGYAYAKEFDFGLELILDGLERHLQKP